MKSLLKYLKAYVKESILGPLFKLLEATFELIVPLLIADIVDIGIASGDKGYVLQKCGMLVLLGVVGLVFSITAQYFSARAAVGASTGLRHALFAHIQKLSYTEIDKLGTSTMITRMTSDINQVQSGINLTLRLLLRSPFVVFGAMVMAFTVNVKAAWSFAVVIPLLSIVVFSIMAASIPLYRRVQQRLDKVLSTTRENLTGVRVIRAFCKEEEEIRIFEQQTDELRTTQKFVGKISALMNPLTYVLINAAIIALIYTGAIQVEAGIITQGAVLALYNYMSQILVELVKLANLIINITKSIACAKRIEAVFGIKPSITEKETTVESTDDSVAVRFENAALTYAGASEPSISGLNLTVKKGETVGVIGGTGCGKTSLIQLIGRFYDATEGAVYVDGVNVKDYKLDLLRDKIGMVMQKSVLFHGSIRDNIRWGKKDATDEEIWNALTAAQAKEVVENKEGKLDALVEQGGRNFSGGQRQRLTIARALVKKPSILILDDAASALDYATDAALRKAIKELPDAPTTFIVSQRAASIRYADQIVVLDDGEVVGIGTHEQLLAGCPVYEEIYYSQFEREEAAVNG